MEFHVYRHSHVLKTGKKVKKWYYYYYDAAGKKVQKACKGCHNRSEAENYIRTILPPPDMAAAPVPAMAAPTIAEIAQNMYIPGGPHVNRREQLGKTAEIETLTDCRRYIKLIITLWGNIPLPDLGVDHVMPYLFADSHSGKWKNRFLEVLGEIYTEAAWHKCRIVKPAFQRFSIKGKKADIFSTSELDRLFRVENFPDEQYYLFFLLCLSGGLRLGEVRAVRVKQIIFDRKVLVIDGFCKRSGARTIYNKKGTPDHPRLRVVYLPDMTLNKMAAWIAARGLQDNDYCFTKDGAPIRQEHLETVFYRALQNTGLIPLRAERPKAKYGTGKQKQIREHMKPADGRKLVIHSLRYTYVSRMRRELTAAELQPMSGHASIEMVDYYNRKVLDMILAALPQRGKEATETLFA